ncbi:MAG TPA: PaaI family thioesterase, partial [Prolixibacteraceae bacterium]|nr:PaaI family thioesterase [Prolixibacteraceae bacterium]
GCSPFNAHGLQLRFFDEGDRLMAEWIPEKKFEGYPDVVHGGIQATLLDEICAWACYVQAGTAGVTQKMNVSFLNPLRVSRGAVTLKARLMEKGEKEARFEAQLFDGEGKCCAEAQMIYFIYPVELARKRFHYPGVEAFFETK